MVPVVGRLVNAGLQYVLSPLTASTAYAGDPSEKNTIVSFPDHEASDGVVAENAIIQLINGSRVHDAIAIAIAETTKIPNSDFFITVLIIS